MPSCQERAEQSLGFTKFALAALERDADDVTRWRHAAEKLYLLVLADVSELSEEEADEVEPHVTALEMALQRLGGYSEAILRRN